MRTLLYFLLLCQLFACSRPPLPAAGERAVYIGSVERYSAALDAVIAPGSRPVRLAGGLRWAEGPVWVPAARMLLFSDVPANKIYKWTAAAGLRTWLQPSGYTGAAENYSSEPGSNGLLLDQNQDLLIAQHGDRRIVRLSLQERILSPVFQPLADRYDGRRFNSPNDLVQARNGSLYFTDPPYGLPGQGDSALRELPFQGVYLLGRDSVRCVLDSLSRPNGIALSPDERTLYVSNSDPAAAYVYAFDRRRDGTLTNGRVFFDATGLVPEEPGLPDGMVVDHRGRVFATGPGGVFVLAPSGNVLGLIRTGRATANVTIGNAGRRLYITADDVLLALALRKL